MIKIELTIEEYLRLTKIEEEWNEYKTQKRNRAASYAKYRKVNANEKKFREVNRAAFRRYSAQVHNDVATLRKIILEKLKDNEKYKYFSILLRYIGLLLGAESFKKYCTHYKLVPENFAQHVIVRGSFLMDKAFKNELSPTIMPEDHALMSKAVFSEQDLQVEQYLPEGYSEIQSEEANS